MLTTIVAFVVTLGVLVFVHEFGHFIVAKAVGIKVEEFALGMGPKVVGRQHGETLYSLRALPLGGFCRMAGENPYEDQRNQGPGSGGAKREAPSGVGSWDGQSPASASAVERERMFYAKSPWQRAAVLAAGPLMNFVLAMVLSTLIFALFGVSTSLSQGTTLGQVIWGGAAAEAGLMPGDRIEAINGRPVKTWDELAGFIRSHPGQLLTFTVRRQNTVFSVDIRPRQEQKGGPGLIGIYPEPVKTQKVGLLQAAWLGVTSTVNVTWGTLTAFYQMITGQLRSQLAGPVAIAQLTGQAARFGWDSLLNFVAILSINLGLINLLPLPALDGGRLVFVGVELVRRRPVNPEKEGFVHFLGFAFLMALLLVITFSDVARIIGGQ
ncbi:MAG: RIP metalloprotease RseP [Firmicutes bacterium]|nr:RIP metalloprotease RseP [Bacillota bacterium]